MAKTDTTPLVDQNREFHAAEAGPDSQPVNEIETMLQHREDEKTLVLSVWQQVQTAIEGALQQLPDSPNKAVKHARSQLNYFHGEVVTHQNSLTRP